MIGSNALISYNCIPQLIQGSIDKEFKLQIRQAKSTVDAFVIELSDGCSWVRGQVVDSALDSINLYIDKAFSAVVTIRGEDIAFLPKYEFRLKNIQAFELSVKQPIGCPVPYTEQMVSQQQIGSNSSGISKVPSLSSAEHVEHVEHASDNLHFADADKVPVQFLSIDTVKSMPVGVLEGKIRAQLLKKPSNVKSFMMITIEDEANDRIQCCCFGALAIQNHQFLRERRWYCFQNMTLQTNNQNGSIELKLTSISKITEEKGFIPVAKKLQRPLSIPNSNLSVSNSNSLPWSNNRSQIKEFDIGRASKQEINLWQDYFIIAKVIKKNQMKAERGRSFECIDAKGHKFQIMLWKECEADVVIGETYRFEDLKAKIYNGNISLQSQGRFTKVTVHSSKIDFGAANIRDKVHTFTSKTYKNSDVVQVREMQERILLDLNKQSSARQIYFITAGYLTVHVGGKERYMDEIKDKLFFAQCEHCKKQGKNRISVEMLEKKIVCGNCQMADRLSIMWNINVVLMDRSALVPCNLNSQVVEKITGKTPLEGLVIFFDSPMKLKQLIESKIHYFRGVFKFIIKANSNKPDKPFYNILEFYDNDLALDLERAKKDMMKSLEVYQKVKAEKEAKRLKAQMLKAQKSKIGEKSNSQELKGEEDHE